MVNEKWKVENGQWCMGQLEVEAVQRLQMINTNSGKNKEIQYICQKVELIKLISRAATACMCVWGTATRRVPLGPTRIAPYTYLSLLPIDIYDFHHLNEISFLIKTLFFGTMLKKV